MHSVRVRGMGGLMDRDCTCLGACKGAEGLAPGWRCAMAGRFCACGRRSVDCDGSRRACHGPRCRFITGQVNHGYCVRCREAALLAKIEEMSDAS